MVNVNDFKTGMTIEYEDGIYSVISFDHARPGKRGAVVKAKLKNLRTGDIIEKTFNAGIKIPSAHITKKKTQFLYSVGDMYTFMDPTTGDQDELREEQIKNEIKFLKSGLDVMLIYYENELLGIELPEKVDYKVIKTEPAVKGNTSTNALKDAIIETGLLVKVQLFIEEGEEIIVSTKDGKYVSRK